ARILGAGPVIARARRRPGGPAPRRAGPDPKERVVDSAPTPSGSAVGSAAGSSAGSAAGPSAAGAAAGLAGRPSAAPPAAEGGPLTLGLAMAGDSATPL